MKRSSAWFYLKARGLPDDTASYYKLMWGNWAGADRIFFPTFHPETGEMIFWVARMFQNEKPEAEKYVNPNGKTISCLFNLDKARQYSTVIITEGTISAIAAGKNAIATFGKNVNDDQYLMLANEDFEEFVIALDGDARQDAVDLAYYLLKAGKQVSMVLFRDGQDPASVPFQKFYDRRVKCDLSSLLELSP
jgi:DNA primase